MIFALFFNLKIIIIIVHYYVLCTAEWHNVEFPRPNSIAEEVGALLAFCSARVYSNTAVFKVFRFRLGKVSIRIYFKKIDFSIPPRPPSTPRYGHILYLKICYMQKPF